LLNFPEERGPKTILALRWPRLPLPFTYKSIALGFFILAILLRGSLCLLNPPENSFDDHYQPISLILQYGTIPAKNDCWECFQPPVFYAVSAKVGRLIFKMGANRQQVKKILQFICCFYSILNIGVIYLILNKLNLSDFSRIIAFGFVCFLPRDIYMAAMHSNDTMSYLFVSIFIYTLVLSVDNNFRIKNLILLAIIMTITLFIKYNTLVVIPIALSVFAVSLINLPKSKRNKRIVAFCLTLLVPFLFFGTYMFHNIKKYGSALPGNYELFPNLIESQPRGYVRLNFLNFKPWESIETPILTPGKLSSFWTLIYSGMWFDTEPKFLCFMDSNTAWWRHYFAWGNGFRRFPGPNPSMSRLTLLEGSGLITLGLFPLILGIIGAFNLYSRERNAWINSDWVEISKMSIFPILFIANTAGIIAITTKLPFYSFMKASFFLISLPAFAVFLGLGVMACEPQAILKRAITIIFIILFTLVFFHIFHIASALYHL